MDLKKLQGELKPWVEHNFPGETWQMVVMGITEEVGELNHALLKQWQGIRLDEDHEAKAKDAVGDIVVFLAHFCSARGWDLDKIVEETWEKVKQRDYTKGNIGGGE